MSHRAAAAGVLIPGDTPRLESILLIVFLFMGCGRRAERTPFDAPSTTVRPASATRVLPPSAFHVQWSPVEFPSEVTAGAWTGASVTFTNISDVSWPEPKTSDPQASGRYAVRLGYWWARAGVLFAEPERAGTRSDLSEPLAPGDRATLQISVRAPEEPGEYRLSFGLVQENVAWFGDQGAEELTVPVLVLPPR